MIDLHTHILPAVDDGVKDMNEALQIIKKAANEGINAIVLTPHIRTYSDWKTYNERIEKYKLLKEKCADNNLPVKLILGAEITIIPEICSMINEYPYATINNEEKYLLMELPYTQYPEYVDDVIYNLLLKGITPIIAHPERYLYLEKMLPQAQQWIDKGVLLQLNSTSINGFYGGKVKGLAKKLIKKNMIHLIGSDVHSLNGSSLLTEAVAKLRKLLKPENVQNIISSNILNSCK
ncbi:capsular polysaccharide biosynthesis protein [Candidatus Magnetoovum chiemensis]|nr:capsular polysaccharide biosynthesis protein [Candidatus Magnetoovum chiemensis]